MSAQPEHPGTPPAAPPMRTLAELRAALRTLGFPGDLDAFDRELGNIGLDDLDLARVRQIVQAYRHRVLLRCNPEGMEALLRPTEDVAAELRRKLADTGAGTGR